MPSHHTLTVSVRNPAAGQQSPVSKDTSVSPYSPISDTLLPCHDRGPKGMPAEEAPEADFQSAQAMAMNLFHGQDKYPEALDLSDSRMGSDDSTGSSGGDESTQFGKRLCFGVLVKSPRPTSSPQYCPLSTSYSDYDSTEDDSDEGREIKSDRIGDGSRNGGRRTTIPIAQLLAPSFSCKRKYSEISGEGDGGEDRTGGEGPPRKRVRWTKGFLHRIS